MGADETMRESLRLWNRRQNTGRVWPAGAAGPTATSGGGVAYSYGAYVTVISANAITTSYYFTGAKMDLQTATDYEIEFSSGGSPSVVQVFATTTSSPTAYIIALSPIPRFQTVGSPILVRLGAALSTGASGLRAKAYYNTEGADPVAN